MRCVNACRLTYNYNRFDETNSSLTDTILRGEHRRKKGSGASATSHRASRQQSAQFQCQVLMGLGNSRFRIPRWVRDPQSLELLCTPAMQGRQHVEIDIRIVDLWLSALCARL